MAIASSHPAGRETQLKKFSLLLVIFFPRLALDAPLGQPKKASHYLLFSNNAVAKTNMTVFYFFRQCVIGRILRVSNLWREQMIILIGLYSLKDLVGE